jgi:hypothetical protein
VLTEWKDVLKYAILTVPFYIIKFYDIHKSASNVVIRNGKFTADSRENERVLSIYAYILLFVLF